MFAPRSGTQMYSAHESTQPEQHQLQTHRALSKYLMNSCDAVFISYQNACAKVLLSSPSLPIASTLHETQNTALPHCLLPLSLKTRMYRQYYSSSRYHTRALVRRCYHVLLHTHGSVDSTTAACLCTHWQSSTAWYTASYSALSAISSALFANSTSLFTIPLVKALTILSTKFACLHLVFETFRHYKGRLMRVLVNPALQYVQTRV
jgi:hypothetical protein